MGSITFSALGNYGWMGNQLFQVAAVLSTAKRDNLTPYFPTSWPWGAKLTGIGAMCKNSQMHNIYTYNEPKFSYTEIPTLQGEVNLHGYFQSEKYFSDNKDYVVDTIESGFIGYNRLKISEIKNIMSEYCFVHVRRGDYLNLQHVYRSLSLEYYKNAIALMKERGFKRFAVLSDDINWCRQHFVGSEYTFFHGDQADDLSIMVGCSGAIIANSSFSWWGSYLGNKSITIAPKEWFSECGPKDWHDLYREEWVLLDC